MVDRESQALEAALCVKAATELVVRFFLPILDVWERLEVKVLLPADQWDGDSRAQGGVVCVRVPGTRLQRDTFELNWLELVSLSKTGNYDVHLCGDEHGMRNFPHYEAAA